MKFRLYVRPIISRENQLDSWAAHIEQTHQGPDGIRTSMITHLAIWDEALNKAYLIFCKFSAGMYFTFKSIMRRPALSGCIPVVIFVGSEKEVVRSYAGTNIAFVTNKQVFWNRSYIQLIGQSMRANIITLEPSPFNRKHSIAAAMAGFYSSRPYPARTEFRRNHRPVLFNMPPKSRFKWNATKNDDVSVITLLATKLTGRLHFRSEYAIAV
jgi:hypothetical protein